MKKVYIAGKISGLTKEEYLFNFESAEKKLKGNGKEVLNPIKMVPEHWDYEDQMKLCLTLVDISDEIYMLKNHKSSNGAIRELERAKMLGKPVYYEEE